MNEAKEGRLLFVQVIDIVYRRLHQTDSYAVYNIYFRSQGGSCHIPSLF